MLLDVKETVLFCRGESEEEFLSRCVNLEQFTNGASYTTSTHSLQRGDVGMNELLPFATRAKRGGKKLAVG